MDKFFVIQRCVDKYGKVQSYIYGPFNEDDAENEYFRRRSLYGDDSSMMISMVESILTNEVNA